MPTIDMGDGLPFARWEDSKLSMHQKIELAAHKAIVPELMSIAKALGNQEHYNELLSRIADNVLDMMADAYAEN